MFDPPRQRGKKFSAVVGMILGLMGLGGCWLGGWLAVGIHVVVIIIAYLKIGILAAIISAVLPMVAEIYWLFRTWHDGELICHLFRWGMLAFAVLTPVVVLSLVFGGILAERSEQVP